MFSWFKRKPKCYGNYKWETKCGVCEYTGKCIDSTNKYRCGIRFKLTNKDAPPPPLKQTNKIQLKLCDKQISLLLYLISYIQNDKDQLQRYIKMMFGKECSEKEIRELLAELRQALNIQR
ncbi:hypothetical protein [Paraclostridium bifermentans]